MPEYANQIELAPQLDVDPHNQEAGKFEVFANFGRAALEMTGDVASSVTSKAKDIAKNTLDTLKPIAASVALAIGGTALAEAPIAFGKPSLEATAPNTKTPTPNEANNNTKKAPNIRFYSVGERKPYTILQKRVQRCLGTTSGGINVRPRSNPDNPTGKRHNKYATAWVEYSKKNDSQKAVTLLNKGKTVCFAFIMTNDGKAYFVERKDFKFKKATKYKKAQAIYSDPFKLSSGKSPSIENITFHYQNAK